MSFRLSELHCSCHHNHPIAQPTTQQPSAALRGGASFPVVADARSLSAHHSRSQKRSDALIKNQICLRVSSITSLAGRRQMDLAGKFSDPRFEILEELGRGGCGVVFRARQHDIGRIVALKVLNAPMGSNPQVDQRRFMNEAKAICKLDHPNIVSVYSVGISPEGVLFIAMEYLQGRSLSSIIQQAGFLSLDETVSLFLQICDALNYAHSQGFLHRDVKPSNVLVVDSGRVKLIDFGLSKLAGAETVTTAGTVLGSLPYLSPEQCQGRPAAQSSDIYALGCSLFECLAGRPPFQGESALETATMHLLNAPPSLRTVNPEIKFGAYADEILAACLAKEPSMRYESAAELHADLQDLLSNRRPSRAIGLKTHSASLPRILRTLHNRATFVACLAVLIIVTGMLLTSFFFVESESRRKPMTDAEQFTLDPNGTQQSLRKLKIDAHRIKWGGTVAAYSKARTLLVAGCAKAENIANGVLEAELARELMAACANDPDPDTKKHSDLVAMPTSHLERACVDLKREAGEAGNSGPSRQRVFLSELCLCNYELMRCYSNANRFEKTVEAAQEAISYYEAAGLRHDKALAITGYKICREAIPACLSINNAKLSEFFARQSLEMPAITGKQVLSDMAENERLAIKYGNREAAAVFAKIRLELRQQQ